MKLKLPELQIDDKQTKKLRAAKLFKSWKNIKKVF